MSSKNARCDNARQNPRAVGSLRNLRQLDSDRRPADHDTINELANVSLRSSAVRGQLAEGLRHESFDIGGWNARHLLRRESKALRSPH